jgi:hypothetical protein
MIHLCQFICKNKGSIYKNESQTLLLQEIDALLISNRRQKTGLIDGARAVLPRHEAGLSYRESGDGPPHSES